MSTTYSIYLNGIQQGKSKIDVSARLALLFKRPTEQIEKILDSARYKIKDGLDAHTASAYRIAIENAGASVEVNGEPEDIVLPNDSITNTLSDITKVSHSTPNVSVQNKINHISDEAVAVESNPSKSSMDSVELDHLLKKTRVDGDRLYRVCEFIYSILTIINVLFLIAGAAFSYVLAQASPWIAGIYFFVIIIGCGFLYLASVFATHFGKVLVGISYSNLALLEKFSLKTKA